MRRNKKKQRKKQLINKQKQKARRQELMFYLKPLLLTFVVWFAALFIIHIPAVGDRVAPFFVSFTAHSTHLLGKIFFLPVELHAFPYLTVNDFTMEVVMECTAYNFYLIVIILTIFSRWTITHKIITLGYFLSTVFLMNKLRFLIMGYVGSYAPDLFDAIHDYLWNIVFGFIVFGIWVWRDQKFQQKIKTGISYS